MTLQQCFYMILLSGWVIMDATVAASNLMLLRQEEAQFSSILNSHLLPFQSLKQVGCRKFRNLLRATFMLPFLELTSSELYL